MTQKSVRAMVGVATVLALMVAAAPAPVRAADQAREAVGLFVQSCLKYVEDPRDLRAWIDATPQLRKFPSDQAQAFLEGKRGAAWSAENDAGLFALVLFAGIREKFETARIPGSYQGTAIGLITAGLMALAFLGFTGMV